MGFLGFLSWWIEGNKQAPPSSPSSSPSPSSPASPVAKPALKYDSTVKEPAEVPGMNGAVAVPRSPLIAPGDVSVIEFGSADKVTLAGYCPVNNDGVEPCRWEILPAAASGGEAPQLRIVF